MGSRIGRKGPIVHAGRLRHRVAIHRPPGADELAADDFGQPIEASSEVGRRWADVLPVRSSEGPGPAGQRLEADVSHVVTFRAGVDVREGDWIEWRGLRLDVVGLPRDLEGRRRRVEVPCLEHSAARSIADADPDPEI